MHFPRGLLLALLLSPRAFPQQADPTFDDAQWQTSPPRRYTGLRWHRTTVQIPAARRYSNVRLTEVGSESGLPLGRIADAARSWGQNDDITVVTIRRPA